MTSPPKRPSVAVVLLDLGEVVVDVDIDRGAACWTELTNRPRDEFARVFFDSGIKDQMDVGDLTAEQALQRIQALTDGAVTPTQARRAWNAILSMLPHMTEAILAMSKKVRLGVISNTDPIHAAHIEAEAGISTVVQHWTYSFTSRSMKPDEGIYLDALEAMGVTGEAALLIDDRPENIVTARRLGITCVHFSSFGAVRAALVKHALLTE